MVVANDVSVGLVIAVKLDGVVVIDKVVHLPGRLLQKPGTVNNAYSLSNLFIIEGFYGI